MREPTPYDLINKAADTIEKNRHIRELAEGILNAYDIQPPIKSFGKIIGQLGGDLVLTEWDEGIIKKDRNLGSPGPSFVIQISKHQSQDAMNWHIAHNLGHLFLHMGYQLSDIIWEKCIPEKIWHIPDVVQVWEANTFARSFLLPSETFGCAIENARSASNPSKINFSDVAREFCVPYSAVTDRYAELQADGLLPVKQSEAPEPPETPRQQERAGQQGGISDALGKLPDTHLIEMCNQIYEWKYGSGKLPASYQYCSLDTFSLSHGLSLREGEEAVLEEAMRRYKKLSMLLFAANPTGFLQL